MRSLLIVGLVAAIAAPCGAVEVTDPTAKSVLDVLDVDEGARVRLNLSRERKTLGLPSAVEGRVLTIGPEIVTLELESLETVTVPVRVIEGMKVRAERYPRSRGAGVGLGIGAGVGAAMGLALLEAPCEGDGCYLAAPLFIASVPVMMGLGATIGALVSPGYRWEERRVRVAVRPVVARSGGGVAVTVSF